MAGVSRRRWFPFRKRSDLGHGGDSSFEQEESPQPPSSLQNLEANTAETRDLDIEEAAPQSPSEQEALVDLGFILQQADEWLAHGLSVDQAKAWRETEFNFEDSLAFARLSQSPESIHVWLDEGIAADSVLSWLKIDRLQPREARRWQDAEFSPEECEQWIKAGILYPHIAANWRAESLTPSQARNWFNSVLETNPNVTDAAAYDWAPSLAFLERFSPKAVRAWELSPVSRASDGWASRIEWILVDTGPDQALRWTDLGISPATAQQLRVQGLSVDKVFSFVQRGFISRNSGEVLLSLQAQGVDLLGDEIEFLILNQWYASGVDRFLKKGLDYKDLAWLQKSGMGVNEILHWLEQGQQGSVIVDWVKLGVKDARWANHWSDLGLDPSTYKLQVSRQPYFELAEWQSAGFLPTDIDLWKKAGVESASQAKEFKRHQISRDDAGRWIIAGISNVELIYQWLPVEQDPSVAVKWVRLGLGPSDFTRLSGNLPRNAGLPLIHAPQGSIGARPVRKVPSPPKPLPTFPTPSQEQVRETLKSSRRRDPFEEWLKTGRPHLDLVGGRPFVDDSFLKFIYDRGFDWLKGTYALPGIQPEEDWLKGVLLRADLLKEQIRVTVSKPAIFNSQVFQVALAVGDDHATAWVGAGGQGTLTSFSLPGCRPKTSLTSPGQVAAAGLAIAWFLDLSVSLRTRQGASRNHPHYSVESKSSTIRDSFIRYVPTPRFAEHQKAVSSGQHRPRPTHQVEGHIRNLDNGRRPSDEARDNAPAYMRLRPNQTFVRSHIRGAESDARGLTFYLSQYSALAEAIGSA
jgi:hypothetical protein